MIRRLEEMSSAELIKRVRLNAELAQVLDGLWFMEVERPLGYDTALEMDVEVWKRYARISKKRILNFFNFTATGLAAVKEFLEYDPWLQVEIEEETPERLVFRILKCPGLDAMEKMGRERFTCDPVELEYFVALAQCIDPRIKVKALKLPPRESPEDICCRWLFTLDAEPES